MKWTSRPPDIDENVKKHLGEWAKRLADSQRPNGGIREHPDKGFAQVWGTSQSLAGLLSPPSAATINLTKVQRAFSFIIPTRTTNLKSQSETTINPTNVQQAFSFIERTRITNLELKGDIRDDLARHLAPFVQQGDFSKLPIRFPTFTLVLRVLGLIGGGTELIPEAVRMLEENRDKYFTEGLFEGWGYYEQFDWGVTEVGAWVAIADTSDVTFARTYSTVMVLWAMAEAVSPELGIFQDPELGELRSRMSDAVRWFGSSAALVRGKGWKVNPANPTDEEPFLGLTAHVLSVLGRVPVDINRQSKIELAQVKRYLLSTASHWTRRSLQDNNRMHDSDCYFYPTHYVIEPSTFLWYPWGVSLMRSFSIDPALTKREQNTAAKWLKRLQARAGEFGKFVDSEYNYVAAEALLGFRWPMEVRNVMTQ